MKTISTEEKLLRLENEELRSRLTEAEETLNAIRNGEVDAILVDGPGGDQVFTLASAETPYRIIVEEMNEGAVSISKNGTILYCNRRCAELLALKPEQIVGSKFTRFVAESDRPKFQSLLKTTTGKKCDGIISCLIHKSNPLHFLLSFSPIPSDILGDICIMISDISELKQMEIELRHSRDTLEHKVSERTKELTDANDELTESRLAVLNMMEDIIEAKNSIEDSNTLLSNEITERKLAMAALKESEERYKSLFENTLLGILVIDRAGIYLMSNKTASHQFGLTPKSLVGKSLFDFLPQEAAQKYLLLNQSLFDSDGQRKYEDSFLINNELKYFLIFDKCLHDKNGAPYAIQSTSIDITERKLAEDEIKRINNELAILNAEKDKFFSVIAHDLRGPFNGFLGLFRLMEEELPSMRLDEIQKITQTMGKSAKNLYRLIENLLDWSRMERGMFKFNPVRFILMPKVLEMLSTTIQSAAIKGIEISYDIPAYLKIIADGNMVAGALRNLTSNAVKFTPKGGKVLIAAKVLPGNQVEISIKDSGIGMNQEILSNLFRLDVQTNRKGTEGEPSAGLGLIICKEFVEKNGGRLWVESEEGKGSTFYFTVPMDSETGSKIISKDGTSDLKERTQTKKLKILIVEDDEASKMILSIAFTRSGNTALQAGTGVEAVDACRQNPDIDLILMDINLPAMDGYEATRQIRVFNKNIIIIAQTAYALNSDRQKAFDAGCNDYISKPVDKDELFRMIQHHFNK
ncbi:MAG: PAS domain S-box protein [Bacteroidota bacterium]